MSKKAFFMALFTVVIWASSFAGVRASLLGGYTSGHLVLVRFLIASAVFFLFSLLPGIHFKLPRKGDILRIMLLGWMGITVYHVGLTFGVDSIPAGTASMIVGSAPVFTAIIAVFILKERLKLASWIGLAIGFIGIILITIGSTGGTSFSISEGAFFVLIATIASSIFFVLQKPLYKRYKPIELTAYFTWAGTLPLLLFLPGLFENMKQATMEAHFAAIFVGLFPAALGYATWAIAISLGNPSTITSMLYIEPAIAIIIAWFWLGEWPNTLSLIGGMIAISSVFIVNFMGRKQQRQKKDN